MGGFSLDEWPGGWPFIYDRNQTVIFNRANEWNVINSNMANSQSLSKYFNLDNSIVEIFHAPGAFENPIYSYSGKYIAVFKEGHIKIFDASSFHQKIILAGGYPSWSFDDEYLLIHSFYESKRAFFVSTVREDELFPNLKIFIGYGNYAFWSPELKPDIIDLVLSK